MLEGRDWLVGGGVTIADIDIYGVVAYSGQAQIDLAPFAHVRRWMSRVEALPRFKNVDAALPKESTKA